MNRLFVLFISRFFGKIFFHFPSVLELPFCFFLLLLIFVSLLLLWFLNRGMIHRGTRSPNELDFYFFLFLFTYKFCLETVFLDDGENVLPNPAGDQAQPADAPLAPAVQVPAILNPPRVPSIPSSMDPGRTPEDRVREGTEAAVTGCCSSFVECLCSTWCDSF